MDKYAFKTVFVDKTLNFKWVEDLLGMSAMASHGETKNPKKMVSQDFFISALIELNLSKCFLSTWEEINTHPKNMEKSFN